jgi:hypothetical protein
VRTFSDVRAKSFRGEPGPRRTIQRKPSQRPEEWLIDNTFGCCPHLDLRCAHSSEAQAHTFIPIGISPYHHL